MKTLLLGSTGLLGQAMSAELDRRSWPSIRAARSDAPVSLDIADLEALARVLEAESPELVVNCAALADIPRCETEPALAWTINARPVALLADWSKRSGGRLLQVSTDHFFTDGGARAHSEDEAPHFLNEYARSKFTAEAFALSAPLALVLRTSIVGLRGWEQPTFAEWAIRSIEQDEPITLYSDAYTSAIDTRAFARAALDLVERGARGLLNCAASEVYTKEALIRALAAGLGRTLDNAVQGSASELVPRRPTSLGLDVARAEAMLGYRLPGLPQVVEALLDQYRNRSA